MNSPAIPSLYCFILNLDASCFHGFDAYSLAIDVIGLGMLYEQNTIRDFIR